MNIEPLKKQFVPDEVITSFLKGDRFALGPFRTDGEYLYLNNDAIAYRDNFGGYWKAIQPTATPPIKDPYQGSFVGALMITLPVVGLFFWFMYITMGV